MQRESEIHQKTNKHFNAAFIYPENNFKSFRNKFSFEAHFLMSARPRHLTEEPKKYLNGNKNLL